MSEKTPLTRKDYLSSNEPRWCPGCGDYAILKGVTNVFSKLQIPREKLAIIGGIGCSSRFPHYTNTYGFHTIHGRAPTVAQGIKLARPDMSTWIITGDGDGLSIGGNHFMHLFRRNPDIKMILFNNQIYGLTKGQTSPTSKVGTKTKSTPFGSLSAPVNPTNIAIAAGASFVARVADRDVPHMEEVLTEAYHHKGAAMIEVLQNCIIFNDAVFAHVTDRKTREDRTIKLKHGDPLIFGANKNKGVRLNGLNLEIVDLEKDKVDPSEILVHDAETPNPALAHLLSQLEFPEDPYPLGVFRKVSRPVYEESVDHQHHEIVDKLGKGDLQKLFHSVETWEER